VRVGIVTYGLDRPLTGIGRYTVEFVSALAQLPDAPEIILLTAGGSGPLSSIGVQTVTLPACRLLPALLTLGNALIAGQAKRLKLDILHDPIGVTPFLFGGAKTVVTVHDVFALSIPGYSTQLDTLIYRHWLPRVLPNVHAVVTVSEASQRDIMRYLRVPSQKLHITSEGATPLYRPAPPEQIAYVRGVYGLPEHYLLFVGSIEERKNLRRVLEAYALVREQGFPHALVVVGPQKWKYAPILEKLRALHLEEAVIFTGYARQEDLPALYTGADAFVFPSLYEGFGLPVLEAMACGAPVITSNTSSLPEVAGDAALLVDPYDVSALQTAITQLLTQSSLRATLRAKGLARAQRFSWQHTAQQTLAVYHSVLA
jgi:glycosyltransferase involved in cell wall biosynthesis